MYRKKRLCLTDNQYIFLKKNEKASYCLPVIQNVFTHLSIFTQSCFTTRCLSLQEYYLSVHLAFSLRLHDVLHFKRTFCLSVCLLSPPLRPSKMPFTSKELSVCLCVSLRLSSCFFHFVSMSNRLVSAVLCAQCDIRVSATITYNTHTSFLSPSCSHFCPSSCHHIM